MGKESFDLAIHNAQFFQKEKAPAPVRLFFLEVALWDIIGKVTGQPLYKLWGAAADKVQPYASSGPFLHDARGACRGRAQILRTRVPGDQPAPASSGPQGQPQAGGHREESGGQQDGGDGGRQYGQFEEGRSAAGVWDFETASMMARELEQIGLYWLEEPLNRYDYDDLAKIRRQLKRMHLAGGEGNVGLKDYRDMLGRSGVA